MRTPNYYPYITGHKADEEAWLRHLQREQEIFEASWWEETKDHKVVGYGGEVLDLGELELERLQYQQEQRMEEHQRILEITH